MSDETYMLEYETREQRAAQRRQYKELEKVCDLCTESLNGGLDPLLALSKIVHMIG